MRNRDYLFYTAAGAGLGAAAIATARCLRSESLRGQIALITGGSRGLGLSLARRFAREGCPIAICARDERELACARADLEARGARALAVPCDITDREQVARMIDAVRRHYGTIDILVNNAGVIQVGPLDSMTLADFETAMASMFWGAVYPTLEALPHMLTRGCGRIVNITSIGGKVSVPHLLPYNCAKFAAVGFSEGLRAELRGRGIKVTTIVPGLMRTGSYLNAFFKGDANRESRWFALSASLPGMTIGADRAARQIVAATKQGRAERVLTTPAGVLALFHGLFPGITADILGLADRLLLPQPVGGTEARKGSDVQSLQSPSMKALTTLSRAAARRYLQPQAAGTRTE